MSEKQLSQAAIDVLAERLRQIEDEGRTPETDDLYLSATLAKAAACYAIGDCNMHGLWPWGASAWKPTAQRGNLVKAGALILAEIERLDRAELRGASSE